MDIGQTDLIKELELENISEEDQRQIVADYSQALQNRLTVRIMDELTESQKQELEQLLATGDQDAANKYITEKVPNLDFIAGDEFRKFKTEVLEMNANIREAQEKLKESQNSQE